MKNILNIAKHDLKKITGSVVAIVTVIGLCIVPCSYAWFNILSNWAPYESDATGRISVAVASVDEGVRVTGLEINVGDKIIDALQANDDIGWVFSDSEKEAIDDVYAGDCYAALIVPADFSRDVLSFMNGDLTNPKIIYFENEKKNAIAPKITGKAKTALQEQVNATFVETLAGYVTDAAAIAEASGTDPVTLLSDLSKQVEGLGRDINSCIALSDSAAGLTSAAGTLMDTSGTLIDSTQDVLDENDKMLDDLENSAKKVDAEAEKIHEAASKFAMSAAEDLAKLNDDVAKLLAAPQDDVAYRAFVLTKAARILTYRTLKSQAAKHAADLEKAGFKELAEEFKALSEQFGTIVDDLSALELHMDAETRAPLLDKLAEDIKAANDTIDTIKEMIRTDIETSLENALSDTKKSVNSYRNSLKSANKNLGRLSGMMGGYGNSLAKLEKSVDSTTANLKSLQRGAGRAAGILSNAAGNDLLLTLSRLMENDETAVAEYLANPIKMDSEVLWPIENYGSAMAPFYTVLAQWVGALLTAVLIKVKVKKRDDLVDLKLHEWYFGRYGLYLLVGIAQAVIVSIGDLLYVRIQCVAPLHFVLLACINGIVFMMINYALVFALDNIGLGAGVIILVLQVAGSGGTYPVEVLPEPFKVIYPFMPFRYSMNAMRECIAGMYDGTYWKCIGVLMVFLVFSVAFGLAFYRPAKGLNEMIASSKAKSEIML